MAASNNKKILLILRHGKAIEKYNEISDYKRYLNKQGKNQAAAIGKLLEQIDLIPEFIISSSAIRAIDTAKIVAECSGYNEKINSDQSLYYQNSVEQYIKVLGNTLDKYNKVLIVGHNPSVENLIEKLTNKIERMKTCYLAKVDLEIKNWKEINSISSSNNIEKINEAQIWHPNINNESFN